MYTYTYAFNTLDTIAVLKEIDPTFENPDQDSQMCLRLEEMSKKRAAKEVSDFDTYEVDGRI